MRHHHVNHETRTECFKEERERERDEETHDSRKKSRRKQWVSLTTKQSTDRKKEPGIYNHTVILYERHHFQHQQERIKIKKLEKFRGDGTWWRKKKKSAVCSRHFVPLFSFPRLLGLSFLLISLISLSLCFIQDWRRERENNFFDTSRCSKIREKHRNLSLSSTKKGKENAMPRESKRQMMMKEEGESLSVPLSSPSFPFIAETVSRLLLRDQHQRQACSWIRIRNEENNDVLHAMPLSLHPYLLLLRSLLLFLWSCQSSA